MWYILILRASLHQHVPDWFGWGQFINWVAGQAYFTGKLELLENTTNKVEYKSFSTLLALKCPLNVRNGNVHAMSTAVAVVLYHIVPQLIWMFPVTRFALYVCMTYSRLDAVPPAHDKFAVDPRQSRATCPLRQFTRVPCSLKSFRLFLFFPHLFNFVQS